MRWLTPKWANYLNFNWTELQQSLCHHLFSNCFKSFSPVYVNEEKVTLHIMTILNSIIVLFFVLDRWLEWSIYSVSKFFRRKQSSQNYCEYNQVSMRFWNLESLLWVEVMLVWLWKSVLSGVNLTLNKTIFQKWNLNRMVSNFLLTCI